MEECLRFKLTIQHSTCRPVTAADIFTFSPRVFPVTSKWILIILERKLREAKWRDLQKSCTQQMSWSSTTVCVSVCFCIVEMTTSHLLLSGNLCLNSWYIFCLFDIKWMSQLCKKAEMLAHVICAVVYCMELERNEQIWDKRYWGHESAPF